MVISFVEMPFSLRLEGNHAPFEAAARRKLLWLSRDDDNRLKMNRFHEGLDANQRRSWLNSRNGKISDCRYSTMHGMPVTGSRGFRGLKPLWYNGVPP